MRSPPLLAPCCLCCLWPHGCVFHVACLLSLDCLLFMYAYHGRRVYCCCESSILCRPVRLFSFGSAPPTLVLFPFGNLSSDSPPSRLPRTQSSFGFSGYRRIGEASDPGPAVMGRDRIVLSPVNLTGFLKRIEDLNFLCAPSQVVCCQESGPTSPSLPHAKALSKSVGWSKFAHGPLGITVLVQ